MSDEWPDTRDDTDETFHTDVHDCGTPVRTFLTDGGHRCGRCGQATDRIVRQFPAPTALAETAIMCLRCWRDRIAETTALSEDQAFVLGAEAADLDVPTIGKLLGQTNDYVREQRIAARDLLLEGGDGEHERAQAVVRALDIPLAGQRQNPESAN